MWASKIPCIVTESTTLPVIVPVIARAGTAGRARVRMRATNVELTARRTSVEVTWGSLLKGSPQRGVLVEITTDVRRSIRAKRSGKVSRVMRYAARQGSLAYGSARSNELNVGEIARCAG